MKALLTATVTCVTHHQMHEYKAALQSHQLALAIRIKLFGEQHESTTDSYRRLSVTQYEMYDYIAALQSDQLALGIRIKLFGEEHDKTCDIQLQRSWSNTTGNASLQCSSLV